MTKFNYITPPDNAIQVVFRVLSTIIARRLALTPVTPNQVTLFRTIIVIFSLVYFAAGDPISLFIAVALFYVFEVLDHVDGDLARLTKQFSKSGPLLEQFIDTWSSRPSNVFGFCIALGMYNFTSEITGFLLFGATVFGRLLWLEYREDFGWVRSKKDSSKEYRAFIDEASFVKTCHNFAELLYTWNNSFLLLGALLVIPMRSLFDIDSMIVGFAVVAALNNLPWIAIVVRGFKQALAED